MPLLRPLFLFVTVMLMLAVAWGAVYLNNRGFTSTVRQQVAQRFREMGVELRMNRLTMEPQRGVVARDVRIYESEEASKDKDLPLARFNEVALDVDFFSVINGDFDVTRVTLEDAALYLPVKYKNADLRQEQRFLLNQVNARVNFQGESLMMQATGRLGEIQWQLAGSIRKPQQEPQLWLRLQELFTSLSPLSEKEKAKTSFYRAKMNELWVFLKDCNFEGGAPPKLKLEINGDLDNPRQLVVALNLHCGNFTFDDHEYTRMEADVRLEEGVLKLERFLILDADGPLQMTARLPLESTPLKAEWALESTSPMAMLWTKHAIPAFRHWTVDAPFKMKMQGAWRAGEVGKENTLELAGRFEASTFRVYQNEKDQGGDLFISSSGDLSYNGSTIYLRNWKTAHATGNMDGQVLRRGPELLTEVESTMDPIIGRRLLKMFGEKSVRESKSE